MNDNTMTSVELRAILGLGTVFSLRMLGMFMVLPVLTIYGEALNDASEFLIGVAIGIYGLIQVICQIPLGIISDRVGYKFTIIGGLIIFSLGSFIAAISNSIWGVIAARALQGSGAISATIMALISDLTREQNRTKAMMFIGISFGIAFSIALLLGPIITHAIGLHGLFWFIGILALIGIIVTTTVVPSSDGYHLINRQSNIIRDSFRKVITNSQLLKLNFSILCLHAILMSNFVVLPNIISQAGILPVNQWKLYLSTMLISLVVIIPCIIYAEVKRCIKNVFSGCIIVLLISEMVLGSYKNHLWSIYIGIQLFFIAFNLIEAILPSIISKETPAGYNGTAMGVYSTSQFLGVAFGGMLGGALYQIYGARLVFLSGAIIALIWWFVICSLQELTYVSSLRIALSQKSIFDKHLVQYLYNTPGVTEVILLPEEGNIYIKADTKKTSRAELESIIRGYTTS